MVQSITADVPDTVFKLVAHFLTPRAAEKINITPRQNTTGDSWQVVGVGQRSLFNNHRNAK